MLRALRPLAFTAAVAILAAVPVMAAPSAAAQTMRDRQWYLGPLDVAAAHKITQGDGVVVAVIDTGVGKHPDIDGQVLAGVSFLDSDDNSLADGDGHGSSMAGLIVAKGGGADHLLGIAPRAKVLAVRHSMPRGAKTHMPEAIRWAVDHGAKVINISEGGKLEPGGEDAVRYALEHDVLVVAAVGNVKEAPGQTDLVEPARFPGVLAVTAVDREGKVWDGAIHGPGTVLAAPGVDIPLVSAAGGGRTVGYYLTSNGTSDATAIVSGAAALVRAKYPQLPVKDVIQRLIGTADDAGAPGRDPEYGFGRLNLVKALTADVPPAAANPLLPAAGSGPSAAATAQAGGGGDTAAGMRLAVLAGGIVVVVLLVAGLLVLLVVRRRA